MRRGTTEVVVVDDSTFMQTLISKSLEEAGLEVVGRASNGAEAVEQVRRHDPDVVTMDLEMPEVDGVEGVRRIMDAHPVPVLILSAHAGRGSDVTFQALDEGAVDFVAKPGGEVTTSIHRIDDALVEKVREVARADVRATRRAARDRGPAGGEGVRVPPESTIVVGASTGGPNVVEQFLTALSPESRARVLVVQHMPDGFTGRFADRLNDSSAYRVTEARDGQWIRSGEAVVARGGYHLEVERVRDGDLQVSLTSGPELHGVRPAIDVTMESVATQASAPLAGVLCTGMGADGVVGMDDIQRVGGVTIAQNEATSAVFGMPRRAIERGVVDAVEPAADLAEATATALSRRRH